MKKSSIQVSSPSPSSAASPTTVRPPNSTSSGTSMDIPVIQSVSSLAGAGEVPSRPDMLPTQPIPATQLGGSFGPTPPPMQATPPPPPQVVTRTGKSHSNTRMFFGNIHCVSKVFVCYKTTLNTGGVGGAGANPQT